jgi:hypothetical protein
MAVIPSGTKFLGIDASVPTPELNGARINSKTEHYTIEDLAAARPYKVYTAIISQSGTSAPTVDVLLENTLEDTITFTYNAPGEYYINSANNKFTSNKTVIMVSPGRRLSANVTIGTTIAGTSGIVLHSHLASGTLTNSLLSGVSVEIRVYN